MGSEVETNPGLEKINLELLSIPSAVDKYHCRSCKKTFKQYLEIAA